MPGQPPGPLARVVAVAALEEVGEREADGGDDGLVVAAREAVDEHVSLVVYPDAQAGILVTVAPAVSGDRATGPVALARGLHVVEGLQEAF